MMQHAIVAVVVLCAALMIVRRYAPPVWKAVCAGLAASGAKRMGWHSLAERLSARQSASPACASGCATCGGCEPAARSPAGEYVVVIERLKRKG